MEITVCFVKTLAPVEIGLTPYPRLVMTAHFGFYLMDPTEVSRFCYPAQERADRDIFAGIGIAHLDRDNLSEVFSKEIRTVNGGMVLPETRRTSTGYPCAPALSRHRDFEQSAQYRARRSGSRARTARRGRLHFLVHPWILLHYFCRHRDNVLRIYSGTVCFQIRRALLIKHQALPVLIIDCSACPARYLFFIMSNTGKKYLPTLPRQKTGNCASGRVFAAM